MLREQGMNKNKRKIEEKKNNRKRKETAFIRFKVKQYLRNIELQAIIYVEEICIYKHQTYIFNYSHCKNKIKFV